MCLPIEIFEIIFENVDFKTGQDLKLCNKLFHSLIFHRRSKDCNSALNEIKKCATKTPVSISSMSIELFILDFEGNKYREIYNKLTNTSSKIIKVDGIKKKESLFYELPRNMFITSLTFDSTVSKSFVEYKVGGTLYTVENLRSVKSIISGCLPIIPVLYMDKYIELYCENQETNSRIPLLIVKGHIVENPSTNLFEAPIIVKTRYVLREFIKRHVTDIHYVNAPLAAIFIRANLPVLTNIKNIELLFDEKVVLSVSKPWRLLNSDLCVSLADKCVPDVLKCIKNVDTNKILVIPIIGYSSIMCLPNGNVFKTNNIKIEFEQAINRNVEIEFEYLIYNISRQINGIESITYNY